MTDPPSWVASVDPMVKLAFSRFIMALFQDMPLILAPHGSTKAPSDNGRLMQAGTEHDISLVHDINALMSRTCLAYLLFRLCGRAMLPL